MPEVVLEVVRMPSILSSPVTLGSVPGKFVPRIVLKPVELPNIAVDAPGLPCVAGDVPKGMTAEVELSTLPSYAVPPAAVGNRIDPEDPPDDTRA